MSIWTLAPDTVNSGTGLQKVITGQHSPGLFGTKVTLIPWFFFVGNVHMKKCANEEIASLVHCHIFSQISYHLDDRPTACRCHQVLELTGAPERLLLFFHQKHSTRKELCLASCLILFIFWPIIPSQISSFMICKHKFNFCQFISNFLSFLTHSLGNHFDDKYNEFIKSQKVGKTRILSLQNNHLLCIFFPLTAMCT